MEKLPQHKVDSHCLCFWCGFCASYAAGLNQLHLKKWSFSKWGTLRTPEIYRDCTGIMGVSIRNYRMPGFRELGLIVQGWLRSGQQYSSYSSRSPKSGGWGPVRYGAVL